MQVNIQELVQETGLKEKLYPGRRLVKKYAQPGKYKSHSVVFDWRSNDLIKVELKAGVSGTNLDLKDLQQYPVSYQAPTYLELVTEDLEMRDKEDEEDTETRSGKSSGGGKKPSVRKLDDASLNLDIFGQATDGNVQDIAKIQKFVVMGKELAQEAFAQAFENLKEQLHQTKVMAMDIMKGVNNIIQKATPGGGLEAKGNESLKYKYDSDKNAPLFGAAAP